MINKEKKKHVKDKKEEDKYKGRAFTEKRKSQFSTSGPQRHPNDKNIQYFFFLIWKKEAQEKIKEKKSYIATLHHRHITSAKESVKSDVLHNSKDTRNREDPLLISSLQYINFYEPWVSDS